ncbi:unnamed protein product [Boreogadus saida]
MRAMCFLVPTGPDFRDLVRASETGSGLQRPGPGFRDLVRASETWSGLQRPGPGFRDRPDRSVGGGALVSVRLSVGPPDRRLRRPSVDLRLL